MSIAVEPSDLAGVAQQHGPAAYVLTTGADGRPRVIHVAVDVADDGTISAVVGRSAAANAIDRPDVCVLWPAADDGFSLIADGKAIVEGQPGPDTPITVAVTSAVKHRPART
ncbi:MAG: hypothetical protein KTU85_03015 [Acidimicrobiia bacterium]|nr:hypothetical protein [Acidimicrobiia bacterium]